MDYSALVAAIQEEDVKTANELCAEALPILKKYLISTLGANLDDAEDAVQKMFLYVIPKIQQNGIESPTGLLSYMLTGCRHAYIKIIRETDPEQIEVLDEELPTEPGQIWNLISEERESILQECLKKLKASYRSFIEFLFNYPDAEAEDIAEYFDISVNNAWTRRHRAVKQLSDCVRRQF